MKKRFFAVFSLILAAVFLVACSSQSTGEKNWEKIEKRGSIKVATAGTLYPQSYHDDKNNLTGYDVEILKEVGKRLKLKIDFTEMGEAGKSQALDIIEKINAAGGTNIYKALETGVTLISQRENKSRNPSILFFTDGVPNYSPARGEVEAMKKLKRQLKQHMFIVL